MLNRVLVLEALFSFSIGIFCFSSALASNGPRFPQNRIVFENGTPEFAPFQHRPVVVKRAEHGKHCQKSGSKEITTVDPRPAGSSSGSEYSRNEIVERHLGQCKNARFAHQLEERRRELQSKDRAAEIRR